MKKIKILIISLIALSFSGGIVFYFYLQKTSNIQQNEFEKENQNKITEEYCLADDEIADYPLSEKYNSQAEIPETPIVIRVINKDTKKEKISFQIDDVDPAHYHPIELHRCGVYVIRKFNYDPAKSEQMPGFKAEVWQYQYNGKGGKLLLLAEKDKNGIFKDYYSYDFRVDPTEIYIALEQGYLGGDDYALIIKDIETKEDMFILKYEDLLKQYPFLLGNFGLYSGWNKDGKYFWGQIFDGANVLAFLRIERDTWKYEVFEAPLGTMGGDALNTELGYVTYDDGPPWTGDAEFAETYQEEWEKEGRVVSFYLYNLFTQEKILLTTTTDTTWHFKPKWISDTELEYELPTGEKKIYKIEE